MSSASSEDDLRTLLKHTAAAPASLIYGADDATLEELALLLERRDFSRGEPITQRGELASFAALLFTGAAEAVGPPAAAASEASPRVVGACEFFHGGGRTEEVLAAERGVAAVVRYGALAAALRSGSASARFSSAV